MQNEMRDRLIELLSQYFNIGDSYAYNLTRDKSAFGIGTMSFDDFEEFDDDTISDITDYLIKNGTIVIDTNVVSPKNRPLIQTIADMPLDEVLDLVRAKQEGRIIVPPCKVGDKVYVDGNSWGEYACIHYENRFIHSKFFVIGEIVSIVKTKKQLLMKIRVESANHSRYYHKRYTVNAIGKTVFFTKKEAEQALKGHEGK